MRKKWVAAAMAFAMTLSLAGGTWTAAAELETAAAGSEDSVSIVEEEPGAVLPQEAEYVGAMEDGLTDYGSGAVPDEMIVEEDSKTGAPETAGNQETALEAETAGSQEAASEAEEVPAESDQEIEIVSIEETADAELAADTGADEAAAGDVAINETNFPDEYFREYVKIEIDSDKNDWLSADERNKVKIIDFMYYAGMKDLKGIEYFPALEVLYCGETSSVEKLDVSKNKALRRICCIYSKLSGELNVSGLTQLTELQCFGNSLSKINVSGDTALKSLECWNNQLTELDAGGLTSLKELECYGNKLSKLNVGGDTALEWIYCSDNQLSSLDLSQNTALTGLFCENNQLDSLDLSQNLELTDLYCGDNQLSSLDLSQNLKLTELACGSSQLSSSEEPVLNNGVWQMDLTDYVGNGSLDRVTIITEGASFLDGTGTVLFGSTKPVSLIYRYDTKASSALSESKRQLEVILEFPGEIESDKGVAINERNFPDKKFRKYIRKFDANSSGIMEDDEIEKVTEISVGYITDGPAPIGVENLKGIEFFKSLISLNCSGNRLSSLDVSQNTELTELDCWNNQLGSLDVSKNLKLTDLSCGDNQLSSLDVSKNTELTYLSCGDNQLSSLDVSSNTKLTSVLYH